jgi:hypothetical protein
MDCIRSAPPAGRNNVIIQSLGTGRDGNGLIMSGEHSCGQLIVKTWVSLIFALIAGPCGRSRMQQRDDQRHLESSPEGLSLRKESRRHKRDAVFEI